MHPNNSRLMETVNISEKEIKAIIEHHARLVQAREAFLLNHKATIMAVGHANSVLHDIMIAVGNQARHDRNLRDAIVVALSVMRRESTHALDAISQHEFHQAWFVMRPAVEAALVVGKWLDDFSFFTLWRSTNRSKAQQQDCNRAFMGKGLVSQSLPNAERIRLALKTINDKFSHWNLAHLLQTAELKKDASGLEGIFVRWGDDSESLKPHAYAFVHLLALVVESTASMLLTKNWIGSSDEYFVLRHVETEFEGAVRSCAATNNGATDTLIALGAWSRKVFEKTGRQGSPSHGGQPSS